MTAVFVFGTLRDLPLLEVVMGRVPDVTAAELLGARTVFADGHDYPISVRSAPDDSSEGLLIENVSAEELARLDFYETGFDYARVSVEVILEGGSARRAEMYRPEGRSLRPGAAWDLASWQASYGPVTRETALEAMSYFGTMPSAEMAALWPVMEARAQARIAARTRPAPRRPDLPDRQDVIVERKSVPYNKFFRLEEYDIRFPRFGGGHSDLTERVAFVSVDAITLLPYDPVRDRTLVVDQFRIGPFARGDGQPWTLEPIAGRVDGGETWEEAAHREAREEAGISLWHLEQIGSYYPSPGAKTEYLSSYIGLADLPDDTAGLFGVAEEAEDIKTRLVDFDELMAMSRDGRIQNAPLMISALWLAAERARLRRMRPPRAGSTAAAT